VYIKNVIAVALNRLVMHTSE